MEIEKKKIQMETFIFILAALTDAINEIVWYPSNKPE